MLRKHIPYIVFIQSLLGVAGSLYMSQLLNFTPCVLCWYQRIFMYPILFISIVGIILKDKKLPLYVLPLSVIGLGFAIYHNLIYYGIISETLSPCYQGIPCNTKQLDLFSFITIPLLSLISFTVITACMILLLRREKK